MTRLFVVLSGEHPTLPLAELQAVMTAEGFRPRLITVSDDVAIVEAPVKACHALEARSSMTLAAGKLLFACSPRGPFIKEAVRKLAVGLKTRQSIRVRVRRFRGAHTEIGRSMLEREIGRILVENAAGRVSVNLGEPQKDFLGILTRERFVFGELVVRVDRGAYDKRRPRTRPFFKPGVLEPRVARVFVNMTRVNESTSFCDPFAGTGGFLVEACSVARYVVGSDVDPVMIRGAKMNLEHYRFANYDVIRADASSLPMKEIECTAFDPPYGRATSTKKRRTDEIVESVLSELRRILRRNGWVVFAFPSKLNLERSLPADFSLKEKHSMRVHRSLTRTILAVRRE